MSKNVGPAADVGIPNFRDVGGHATAAGTRVRAGLLFRSVALDRASEEDLEVLARVGLRRVFDLRTPDEQVRFPDRVPRGAELVPLDVLADEGEADFGSVAAHLREPERYTHTGTEAEMVGFNVATYRDLVRLDSARRAYRALFGSLADGGVPALVHCTGGKDRTGWAVAALLLLLGVSEADVMVDYLASHAPVRALFAPTIEQFVERGGELPVIEAMLSARPDYLRSAIDTVALDHGSIEAYFSEGLDLDDKAQTRLRDTFLE